MDVWMLPLPFFSHVVCCSQLAEHIARHGLAVSLFLNKTDVPLLSKQFNDMRGHWELQNLGIDIKELDNESVALADSQVGNERFEEPLKITEHLFELQLKQSVDRGASPTCVITDFFMPRAGEAALKLGLLCWRFFPTSASFTMSIIHVNHLISAGIVVLHGSRLDKKAQENVISLPGVPLIRVCDLADGVFNDQPMNYELKLASTVTVQADAVLLSCFQDLEPRGIPHLERLLKIYGLQSSGKVPKVWTLGPLFAQSYENQKMLRSSNTDPCITFVDSQPASSVIYVSFGTDVNVTNEQMLELVYGLESTGHPFICVIYPQKGEWEFVFRSGADMPSTLPAELVDRISNKSMFVQWAPQLQILSHPSTGAFISHCGQNSLQESLYMGIPLLAWPWNYDQFINCRVHVEDTQVAMEVCPGLFSGGLVDRKDIENCVHRLFHSPEGAAVRERALSMRQKARQSIDKQGSSTINFQELVSAVKQLRKTDNGLGNVISRLNL